MKNALFVLVLAQTSGVPFIPTSNLWQIPLILGDLALLAVRSSQQLSLDELSLFMILFTPPLQIIPFNNFIYYIVVMKKPRDIA